MRVLINDCEYWMNFFFRFFSMYFCNVHNSDNEKNHNFSNDEVISFCRMILWLYDQCENKMCALILLKMFVNLWYSEEIKLRSEFENSIYYSSNNSLIINV